MGLKELPLQISYETTEQSSQLLEEFYIPTLEQSVKYYRIAGFFSSTALSIVAEGIEGLINNNGEMKLLISPELSEDDYRILEAHGAIENTEAFRDISIDYPDDRFRALAWLLDTGRLKIKIVVAKRTSTSLFHQKVGILCDKQGDMVSFSGSINETAQAWLNNIEEFKVFKSWVAGQNDYVQSDLEKFESYWKNEKQQIAEVYNLPETIRRKIVSIKPRDIWDLNIMRQYKRRRKIKNSGVSLFPHQQKAVEEWISNHYSLLVEMATGTGKTRTALGCVAAKLQDDEKLLVIVSTPQNTLSRQWQSEVRNLHIAFDSEEIIDGSSSNWRKKLELLMLDIAEGIYRKAIIYTTHITSSGKEFIKIIKENREDTRILFICDEVHAIGSNVQRNALLPEYEYRIGLSATPDRMFDDKGTGLIRTYFGKKSFEFTIGDALKTENPLTGRPFLNPYLYFPIFVSLTPAEEKKYSKLSKQIFTLKAQENYDEKELERLYNRRADISKNAANKLPALYDLLLEMNPDSILDTILFVSDKQLEPCFNLLSQMHIKRAKITEDEGTVKTVNAEGDTERQQIIRQFREHALQVLVGIKCLDEGIDISSARVAVILSSSTNPREYVQRVGRVIRAAENKPKSEIYDFVVVSDKFEGLIQKEVSRAQFLAKNASNYQNVRDEFMTMGVILDADQ